MGKSVLEGVDEAASEVKRLCREKGKLTSAEVKSIASNHKVKLADLWARVNLWYYQSLFIDDDDNIMWRNR